MKMKQILAAASAGALMLTLSGCLAFKTSLDLNPTAPTGAIPAATDAVVPSGTLPSADVPTSPSEQTPSQTLPTQTAEPTSSAAPSGAPEQTTAGGNVIPAGNEYDILRSGNFQMSATMIDGSDRQEMNVAVSSDGDLYVRADVDGMEMGILVKNKKTYLLYPPEKKYLELNDLVLSVLQLDPSEFTEIADNLGFKTMKGLDQAASVTDGAYDGTPCKVYVMNYEDGTTSKIYLNGAKLLAVENFTSDGKNASTMVIHSVASGFPAMPPSDYKKSGYMEFLTLLAKAME